MAGSTGSIQTEPFFLGPNLGQAIADHAKQFVNLTPFRWGGTLPTGADQSGFVQQVYNHFGFSMPRLAHGQRMMGPEVPLSEAHPGDLIHWQDSPDFPGADHVAVYAGDNSVIHVTRPGRVVTHSPLIDADHAVAIRVVPHN